MAKDSRTQIIFGTLFLAIAGCKIDVKEGKRTIDVGEHNVKFGHFKGCNSSPSTFSYCGCEVVASDEHVNMLNMTQNYPSRLNYTLFEGQELDHVKVESMPSSIIKDEPYAVDEGYLSELCRFMTLMISMPPISVIGSDMDVDFGIAFKSRLSDGTHRRIIVLMDPVLWKYFILKKDLNQESLRWYLLLQRFDFEVHDKG